MTWDRRCGTGAGYQAHRKRGEQPCEACRDARNAARRAVEAAKPKTPAVREDVASRFWRKVSDPTETGCLIWLAAVDPQGYGRFGLGGRAGRMEMAHRMAWVLTRGPIPEGLQVDHLCHGWSETCRDSAACPHRRCVNPDHLEPVTPKVNSERSTAGAVNRARLLALTHCKRSHEFTPENTYINKAGARRCRSCSREAARIYRETRAA